MIRLLSALAGAALICCSPASAQRTYLAAGLTLEVAPAPRGNDLNDCLTPATPCQHIQVATLMAEHNYDGQGNNITIHVAAGMYNENVHQTNPLVGTQTLYYSCDPGAVIDANNTSPSFYGSKFSNLGMSGCTIQNTGGGDGMYIAEGTVMHIDGGMNYGPTSLCHLHVDYNALIYIAGDYTVSAPAYGAHICYTNNGVISDAGHNINIPYNITVGQWVNGQTGGIGTVYNNIYTGGGSVSGYRYGIALNAVLNTNGHPELLPGTLTVPPIQGGQVN